MKRKSVSVQPDLFEQNRRGVLLVPLSKEHLAALVQNPVARDRGGSSKREGRQ